MKPSILLLLLLFFSTGFLCGQTSYGLYTTSTGNLMVNLPRGNRLTEKNVVGPSGYFFDEYLPGKVYSGKGVANAYDKLRFRVETNRLEILTNKRMVLCTPDIIDGFSLETPNGVLIFIKAYNPIAEIHEFMEVIFSNNGKMILQNIDVTFKRGDFNPALNVGDKDKFIEQKTYFFAENNQLQPIYPGKKKVLSLFKDKAAIVSRYADTNNVGFREIEDVLKLVDFYSTLD